MRIRRVVSWAAVAVAVVLGAICYAPSTLFFPYEVLAGDVRILAEAPVDAVAIADILARADARLATSPLATPLGRRTIYLTNGGWRWTLLSLPLGRGAFAVTRPFSTNIVLNRSDVAKDRVGNNAPTGGRRTLTGTIAHETTHLLINRHYGPLQARFFATWRVEGYCDHVAGESSLSPEDAERLRNSGTVTPALQYFDARRKIEAEAAAGATVDQLLQGNAGAN
ncbi:hypothetical protein [Roseiterribacter gracilis]|uniref:hypothetical protein n=1 Tax=Roseiterribacter gracilis TaxID=2812848 RepID=UPI003B4396EA